MRHDFPASTRSLLCVVATVAVAVGACRGGDEQAPRAKKAPPAAIETVEGMKYYVGGPIMSQDRYGRMRLGGFNGEVSAPTTRGLLIGFKRVGERDFDYRTYVNGRIVSSSTGFLDDDDLLWFKERFTYDSVGKVIARQTLEYDDEREVVISRVEHIDPLTGEVVKTIDAENNFRPLADDESDEFFEGDEEEEDDEDAGEKAAEETGDDGQAR